jgi:hypothetical protein
MQRSKSLPVNWKRPTFVEQSMSYCRAVMQSFIKDWKRFMQAPIQTRKQSRAGTGND